MTGGKSCGACKIIGALVALGAINWGLYGLFNVNLVESVLGSMTTGSKIAYGIIGVAGLMKLLWLFGCCPCQKGNCEPKK